MYYPVVATVLTACGIETRDRPQDLVDLMLQQYLPLAVLKLTFRCNIIFILMDTKLQQYLPLAVLKQT